MRRLIILAALIAVAAVLVVLRGPLSALRFTVPTAAGQIAYAATFDDDSTFNDEWRQYLGRLSAGVENGELVLRVDEAEGGPFSYARPRFTDFDLTVTTRAIEGPVDNGFGVVFRLQNRDNTQIGDDSFYRFLISSDGYYRVVRTIEGDDHIISDWVPSDAIQQGLGAVNTIRVVGQGSRFQFFINGTLAQVCIPNDPNGISTYAMDTCIQGQMYDELQDTSIPEGQIGVIAQATGTGGPGVVIGFDNVLVSGVEAGA